MLVYTRELEDYEVDSRRFDNMEVISLVVLYSRNGIEFEY